MRPRWQLDESKKDVVQKDEASTQIQPIQKIQPEKVEAIGEEAIAEAFGQVGQLV